MTCTRTDFARQPAGPSDGGEPGALHELAALAAEQNAAELQFSPTLATWLGDHHFDDRLDDVRPEAVTKEIGRLRAMQERLARLQTDPAVRGAAALDLQLLAGRVNLQLLDLVDLRPHERNPIFYMNLIAFGLDGLLLPVFVPVEARVRALSRRLRAVPDLCKAAERNLKNPPEIFTRKAIDLGQSTQEFLTTLLPRLIRTTTDPKLVEEFNHSNDEALRGLKELLLWMNRELLPRSRGDFTLSRERLAARLREAELLDVPLETVQAVAERELKETRRVLDEVARRLTGPSPRTPGAHPVAEALRLVEEDHGKPEDLLPGAGATLDELYELITRRGLLTLPAVRPKVEEMPPYRWGYAMLAAPGPLEARGREAFFYVDPVDPSWKDKKRVQDHLRLLNRTQLQLTAIHEVVPGHFVQQEVGRHGVQSPIRQRTRSVALSEGWANYAETLMAEAWPVPGNDKLLFLMLRGQLFRLGRLLTALRLHAPPPGGPGPLGRMEEAAKALSEECYLDDYGARREVERATYDPMYLLPALGRLQLLKLRDDYQAEQGARYSLSVFHDAVLSQGELPVVALRRILLVEPGHSLER